jgi:DNA-binding GntR family transcriptional regulator
MGTLAASEAPLTRTTLAEGAYARVLEAILSGSLTAGTEVRDVSLASELKVSRTPVREALARLLKDGLLVQDAQRRLRVVRFSRPDVIEIYEMRELLESACAERAATRLSAEELKSLRLRSMEVLAMIPRHPGWKEKALEFDVLFHDTLARASGNGRLRADVARYRLLVRAFCRLTGNAENLERAFDEHRQILRALETRNGRAAAKAMGAHVRARLQAVLTELFPEAP